MASIGETVGPADYTTFMATDKYIKEHPDVIQTFTNVIYKAQQWTLSQPPAEVAKSIAQFFPGVSQQALINSAERLGRLKIWKANPKIDKAAMDRFQDILVQGHVLEDAKRVNFDKLVLSEFANKAK
jgi:NitT/TauT family transport system substrate-binding protein